MVLNLLFEDCLFLEPGLLLSSGVTSGVLESQGQFVKLVLECAILRLLFGHLGVKVPLHLLLLVFLQFHGDLQLLSQCLLLAR